MEMKQKCLICNSTMLIKMSLIFEECGHSFCTDCVQQWLTCDHKRGRFNRIKIKSLNIRNLDFDNILTFYQLKFSFPHFYAINENTTDEKFEEMVTNFFTNSTFGMHDTSLEDNLFRLMIECNLYYESIPNLVVYELQRRYTEIRCITLTNSRIIYNSESCLKLYREKLIDRAQFIDYLRIVSDILIENYQQYCSHVNLYKLLMTQVLEHLNRIVSEKLKKFSPEPYSDDSNINLSFSEISDVPKINRIEPLESAISKSSNEDLEQYIFDDLFNQNICLLEGTLKFLKNALKLSEKEKDSLVLKNLLKNDICMLSAKAIYLNELCMTGFFKPGKTKEYVWTSDARDMMSEIDYLISIFSDFNMDDNFSAAIPNFREICIESLTMLQDYLKNIKRCDKILKIEKLLETLLSFWL